MTQRSPVAALTVALILTMTGFMPVAAVLPDLFVEWNLSETAAGWLHGVYFGAFEDTGLKWITPELNGQRFSLLFVFVQPVDKTNSGDKATRR